MNEDDNFYFTEMPIANSTEKGYAAYDAKTEEVYAVFEDYSTMQAMIEEVSLVQHENRIYYKINDMVKNSVFFKDPAAILKKTAEISLDAKKIIARGQYKPTEV